NPQNNEYTNTFGLDYSYIKFYKNIKAGREVDNGGIIDLIDLVISTHIKTTYFDSII
ncbi:unnamed protein product, partial [marine sediment metagenome]